MKVLIIKTSSMGDVIHTLPALTDAGRSIDNIRFDWLVEEAFAEIPSWHPLVDKVIPIAWRRWRKNLFSKAHLQEIFLFRKKLLGEQYDLIIDAQGLLKSVFFSFFAKGPRHGLDALSARESLASFFYQKKYSIERNKHAIHRIRDLFSQVLGYALPHDVPDYGINREDLFESNPEPYLVFLHGTTWPTKHWPEKHWRKLAIFATETGLNVKLPWGNNAEHLRAQRIAEGLESITVLPRLNLNEIVKVIAGAKAIVAVDTGLAHLAAALNVPTISLYGPTNPALTGALGKQQKHLQVKFPCSPCLSKTCLYQGSIDFPLESAQHAKCFALLTAEKVWHELAAI